MTPWAIVSPELRQSPLDPLIFKRWYLCDSFCLGSTSCLGPLRKQRESPIRCSIDCQFSNGFPILTCLTTDLNSQNLSVRITLPWPYCDA